jgi:SAM-dependent methyltransferase
MMKWSVNPFVCAKLRPFYPRLQKKEFRLLDVGCGNHSPSTAKKYFPRVKYFGIDRTIFDNDEADLGAMDTFYRLDLETSSLSEVPDAHFDVILMTHVLEHLRNGLDVLEKLAGSKLKPGGQIYVEFPGVKSLSLPSMEGTLNFCDDDSHVRLYDVKEVANKLLGVGCKIQRAGTRRCWDRMLLLPFGYAYARCFQRRRSTASLFWDLLGFAEFVLAERRTVLTEARA